MIDKLKRLTDGLIVFSALASDFEKLDLKNDALAGIRANYFNSSNSTQSDKTEVLFDEKKYNLSYFMCKNEPLSWKITRNSRPYQSVKRVTGNIYCVIVYGENGIINKRIYFDDNHNWLRTEYYDKFFENILLATLYPKNINDIIVLRLERNDSNGNKIIEDLFPSTDIPKTNCTALVYSNAGMLWYDKSHKPDNFGEYEIVEEDNNDGFNFSTELFNFSDDEKDFFDLSKADYLEENEDELLDVETVETQTSSNDNDTYSAYDRIEKILSEAHKSNKDLFGEVINQVANASCFKDDSCEVTEELNITNEEENLVSEDDEMSALELTESEFSDEINTEDSDETIADSEIVNEEVVENIPKKEELCDFEEAKDDFGYEVCEEKKCDVVIHTKSGRYSYFGSLDANNCRSGKGRTVTPSGNTSYEGEYKDDKRDGFGVCYYNEGNINYVGTWSDGNRNGCGVGYRLSDGTMHIGKWNNNTPVEFGARFDNLGNFIDVSEYSDGQKDGKSISFDVNGNVVIRKYKNGELVSEKIIIDED